MAICELKRLLYTKLNYLYVSITYTRMSNTLVSSTFWEIWIPVMLSYISTAVTSTSKIYKFKK